jgi:chaperonin GroES
MAHARNRAHAHTSTLHPRATEKPQERKVIAIGKGKLAENGKTTALEVKAGDRVLGEEFILMKDEDLLGILR